MFDRVGSSKASPRWRTALMIFTAGGHALVIATLVVVAFWKIERLPVADKGEQLTMRPRLPAAGGPPPGAKLQAAKQPTKPVRKRVVEVTQPTRQVAEPAPAAVEAAPTGTDQPGGGGDNPLGDPESTEIGIGTCATPPCGEPEPAPTTPAPPVVIDEGPVQAVPPSVAAGLRIAGNDQIYPPDRVRVAMLHAGQERLQGTFKLCVSTSGRIDAVRTLKSTGYDDYDAELVREMRAWRYRPYRVDGTPAPMCTVEVVIYRMKK